jgi:deoxycytidylate deaminase
MKKSRIQQVLLSLAESVTPVANARMAACVVLNRRIISFGFNEKKTHPLAKEYGKNPHAVYMHAEIMAIRNALRKISKDDLKKCDLYIVRIKYSSTRKDEMIEGMAMPCEGCSRAIRSFGLKSVTYTRG